MQSDSPCNATLVMLMQDMSVEVNDALIIASDIKLNISLCIPEMQEGNNFGVSIQEEVLDALSRMEESAQQCGDTLSTYYLERGKYISAIYKHPHVVNYRNALTAFDLRQYVVLKSICNDLKSHYCCIHNLYTKNIEKLKQPRTNENKYSIY